MNREVKKARIGHWLSWNIEARGLTKSEFADRVDVANRTVSTWTERRKLPRSKSIRKAAEIFSEVPVSDNGDYLHPPIRSRDCTKCDYIERCRKRLFADPPLPIMCEKLTRRDLRAARAQGRLNETIWWVDVDPETPLGELMNLELTLDLDKVLA